MAASLDAAVDENSGSSENPHVWSHTVGSAGKLIVYITQDYGRTLTSVTWGATTLTIDRAQNQGNSLVHILSAEVGSGTEDITVTYSGAGRMCGRSESWTGLDSGAATQVDGTSIASSTTVSTTLNSVAAGSLVGCSAMTSSTNLPNGTGSQATAFAGTTTAHGGAVGTEVPAGGGNITHSWDSMGSRVAQAMAEFVVAAAAGASLIRSPRSPSVMAMLVR